MGKARVGDGKIVTSGLDRFKVRMQWESQSDVQGWSDLESYCGVVGV